MKQEVNMEEEEIKKIAIMIKTADWYYNYSDDYGVWAAGEKKVKEVTNYVRSKDWNKTDYEKLIKVFFKDTFDGKYGEKVSSDVEYWTKKIKFLTGVAE